MPRKVCVVIGPFCGSKPCVRRAERAGGHSLAACSPTGNDEAHVVERRSSTARSSPSGLPRSQARPSRSPKRWQLAQAASPWPELSMRVVEEAPALLDGGRGGIVERTSPSFVSDVGVDHRDGVGEAVEHVEPRSALSSSATPVGPSPTIDGVRAGAVGAEDAAARCGRRRRRGTPCASRSPSVRRRAVARSRPSCRAATR